MQISIPDGHISCARVPIRRLCCIPVHEIIGFYGQLTSKSSLVHEIMAFGGQMRSRHTYVHENGRFRGQKLPSDVCRFYWTVQLNFIVSGSRHKAGGASLSA